jgi:hypothetical protein
LWFMSISLKMMMPLRATCGYKLTGSLWLKVITIDFPVTLVPAVVQTWTTTLSTTLTMLGTMSCANTGTSTLHAQNAIIDGSGSLLYGGRSGGC